MVERSEHLRVLSLLSRLDADLLRGAGCWFAGGTALLCAGAPARLLG